MPEVKCAHDEMVPLAKLVPNPRNPNKHPRRQIELLVKIIDAQGWRAPITVSTRSGFIVRGHGRFEAAVLLGVEAAPVDFQDYATEAEEWADLVADNRIAELAETDESLLSQLLQDLSALDFDLEIAGFDAEAFENLLGEAAGEEGLTDPDDVPGLPEEPVTKLGDLWLMGNHRLLCGDAREKDMVARLMDGYKAHLFLTDPPYNVDYEGKAGKIQNDHLKGGEFLELLKASFANACSWLIDGGAAYICYSDGESLNFRTALREAGFKLSTCLIWRKNQFVLGRSDYHSQHEPILYGWKPTAAHRWFGGRTKSSLHEFFDGGSVRKTGEHEYQVQLGETALVITGRELSVEEVLTTIIPEERPVRSDLHPTMKPVALFSRFIRNSTKPGEIVLDLYGGSGTTVISCEQTGRIARLMELDPKFCDVIVKRWEEFTGRKAELHRADALPVQADVPRPMEVSDQALTGR